MLTICIIEDIPEINEGLVDLLEKDNRFTIIGNFTTAEKAMEEIPQLKPDIVISDINLPVKSGIDALKFIKKAEYPDSLLSLCKSYLSELPLNGILITAGDNDFVAVAAAACNDFAGRRNDGAAGNHVDTFLEAGLGDAHHPATVLVGARLHAQFVVELAQAVVIGCGRMVHRRVVAAENHVDRLQAEHPVGLGPAPVVADQHAGDAAPGAPGAKAQVANLEATFLQVLEWCAWVVVGVAGQVDLAVFADQRTIAIDQDRAVEAARAPATAIEFAITQVKADTQAASFVEQGQCFGPRHLGLEPRIYLVLILDPPVRKKSRQCGLRERDHLRAHGRGLAHQFDHAPHHGGTCLGAGDGAHLGCGQDDVSGHGEGRARRQQMASQAGICRKSIAAGIAEVNRHFPPMTPVDRE